MGSTVHAYSDQELIVRIAQRDEAALDLLYQRYQRLMYGIALRITNDWALAQEVLQDVFHSVWRAAGEFQRGCSVVSWLSAITSHRAIDVTRSRTFRSRNCEDVLEQATLITSDETGDIVDQRMLREEMDLALDLLPLEQSKVIRLAYYLGMSQAKIAAQLGLPLGTVKTRLRLGLLHLRRALAKDETMLLTSA
jgi:RNA polymerase sigma-70 factor (ECF subfamily)